MRVTRILVTLLVISIVIGTVYFLFLSPTTPGGPSSSTPTTTTTGKNVSQNGSLQGNTTSTSLTTTSDSNNETNSDGEENRTVIGPPNTNETNTSTSQPEFTYFNISNVPNFGRQDVRFNFSVAFGNYPGAKVQLKLSRDGKENSRNVTVSRLEGEDYWYDMAPPENVVDGMEATYSARIIMPNGTVTDKREGSFNYTNNK